MKQQVIIEKLKEQINGRVVKAAVFYSFNFEPKFFENYLLPVFLPEVNFSDNEIQNSILWRQYAYSLPPVTVYCDFHAKYPDAPSLDYQVRTIDIPANDSRKPCFHPKISLILLNDWSLILMIGSNNLTVGGWCTNREVVAIEELKNGKFLPKHFKYPLLKFFESAFDLSGNTKYSKSEELINSFLKQQLYTKEGINKIKFYNSFTSRLIKELDLLRAENDELPFETIEIVSPYITTGNELIRTALEYTEKNQVFVTTPYYAMNEADISEENYNSFRESGIVWSKYIDLGKDKGFRFDHSKIYRLKGKNKIFTIIGSVNFTQAAWKGVENEGNVEASVVYTEPVEKWTPWLTPDNNPDIKFSVSENIEKSHDQRKDAPDISFKLNWYEKTLSYHLKARGDFRGKVLLEGDKGIILNKGENEIRLTKETWIENLSLNPSIKISYNGDIFFFYPEQIGLESKPLSIKLKITDRELLDLWNNIPTKSKEKSEISNLIEEYIRRKTDSEGDIIQGDYKVKSTLNFMASHISALINLEKKIFQVPKLVSEFEIAREFFDYYLFTENIDTLIGYRKMLVEMHEKNDLNNGFYWLILELLLKEFYDNKKNEQFYLGVRGNKSDLKIRQKKIRIEVSNEIRSIEKELLSKNTMHKNEFEWLKSQIV